MPPKRFIYVNGSLIPKKIDKSTQSDFLSQKNEKYYEIINLSTNNNKNNEELLIPKINFDFNKQSPTFQTQLEENIIYDNNTINQKSQANITSHYNKTINNESSKDIDIVKSSSIKKDNNIFIKKLNKIKLYSQIKKLCKHLYLEPKSEEKENIFEKMYTKEYEYVKNLNKDYLLRSNLMIKKNSFRNLSRSVKNNIYNNNNHSKINYSRNKSHKINTLSNEEIIKKYYSQPKYKTVDIKEGDKYKFENYGISSYTYKHPQIYKLKSEKNIKLPFIKKKQKTPIELTNIIPIKKGINREEQRNEYAYYNVLKHKRLKKFQI